MPNPVTITCPVCGEPFDLNVDVIEGDSEFVVDCEICCRPMTVRLTVHNDQIESLDVTAE